MKKFIVTITRFVLFFILFSFTLVLVYIYKNGITKNDIPALNFSNSYAFNEKILFLNKKPTDAQTMAIGSSMTLNNLYSKVVTKELNDDNFLNAASWGMSIKDDYLFLKFLVKRYKIKTLILVTNIVDFQQTEKKIDFRFVEDYMNTGKTDYSKYFNFQYYFDNFSFAHKVRNSTNSYEDLRYDESGTVIYKNDFPVNKDGDRWYRDYFDKIGKEIEYNYLDSISIFAGNNNMKFMIFQSPVRGKIYTNLNASKRSILKGHVERLKSKAESYNYLFVDSNERLWPDSLFVDAIHFNEEGSKLFTEYCFDKIKEQTHNTVFQKGEMKDSY